MKGMKILNGDLIAKNFRVNRAVQSTQPIKNVDIESGISTQKIVFGSIVAIGALGIAYAIHYYIKQKEEKKKNAELVKQNKEVIELLDQKDNYFNEKILNLQRRIYH